MVCLPRYARTLHGATAGKYSNHSSFFNTVVSSHNEVTMCGHILNENIPGRWIGRGVPSPESCPPPVTQPWISFWGGYVKGYFYRTSVVDIATFTQDYRRNLKCGERNVDSYVGRTGLSGLNVIRGTSGSHVDLDQWRTEWGGLGGSNPPEIPKIPVESSIAWARRTGVSISFCTSLCSHTVVIY